MTTVGVLSLRDPQLGTGYVVAGAVAVRELAAHSPDAADWWRQNAPHVVTPGYQLFFPKEVCEPVAWF